MRGVGQTRWPSARAHLGTVARSLAPLLALLVGGSACGPSEPAPCGGVGVICRVVGTGMAAFDGDGKAALETSLYLPSIARRGPDGLVYVMDFNNHRLRRIGGDGLVQTVVGNGVHAVAVEGATALGTPLENPLDFTFDDEGAVILVAYHDPRILRVGEAGVLEVLAGTGDVGDLGDDGPATKALFHELGGVAVASDGRIAVSDDKAHRIRVLDHGTLRGVAGVSDAPAFAGDGGPAATAHLNSPRGLAYDREGRLYIADTGNHRIRRIDAGGIITTVAGNGTAGDGGDGGKATDAELRGPEGVFVLADGTLFIADTGNHRVRRVDPAGTITTVVGSTRGSSGDGGPAISAQLQSPSRITVADGVLLVADQRNHVIRSVSLR